MKKKMCIFLMILITVLIMPAFVQAKNNIHIRDEVTINEKIDDTSFILGNLIKMNSEVEGINFVAGNNITLSSKQDYLFAAGNMINLVNIETKDAFVAGSTISIESSTIRTLYAAGTIITVNSDISKNANLAGDKIVINSKIEGDVYIAAEEITIGEEAVINGTLEYPSAAKINMSKTARISKTKTYKTTSTPNKKEMIASTIIEKAYSFLSMAIIGIILLSIIKPFFNKVEETQKEEILKQILTGFLVLIVTPVAALILICTVVGIPIGIISMLLYGILIYLSPIPTAYFIGKNLFKEKIKNNYSLLLISLLMIYLIKLIPIIGSVVTFTGILFSLGLCFSILKEKIVKAK